MSRPQIRIGRSYEPLLTCTYPFVLVEGPRGTSKTRTILSILLGRALKYPGCRILLARQFRAELTKTVLTTMEDEVFPAFGMKVPGGAGRETRSEYNLDNGSTFFLFGLDQGSGALSMGMTFAYLAEVLQMTERQVTDIAGCMRWMRSPEHPKLPPFTQVICDENPGAPGHWANQRAEYVPDEIRRVVTREDYERLQRHNAAPAADPIHRWKRIVTKIQDNPGYWNHEAWDYHELGRKYVTETLANLTGVQRLRWIDGLHVSAEGSIFPEFTPSRHVVQPFDVPKEWPVWTAWDPGRDHPTAILWVTRDPQGVLYVIDEIHRPGGSVQEFCEEIRRREAARPLSIAGRYADPQYAFSETAFAVKSIADQAEDYGVYMEPWPRTGSNAKELQMIEAMRQLLCADRLKTFATCQRTIDEWQSWMWKRKRDGSLKDGEDVPEDKNNHAMDCIKGLTAAGIADLTPRYSVHAPAAPSPAFSEVDWSIERGEVGVRMNKERNRMRTRGVV